MGCEGIWTSARFVEDTSLVIADTPVAALQMAAEDSDDHRRYVSALEEWNDSAIRCTIQIAYALKIPRVEMRLSNADNTGRIVQAIEKTKPFSKIQIQVERPNSSSIHNSH